MSLQLLKHLNGNNAGGLKKFIDKFEGRGEPRICWYPSSGEDFRALLYLHPGFSAISPPARQEPDHPDIFLYTDYFPWKSSTFLDSRIIYNDDRTYVLAESIEELPGLDTTLHSGILDFPEGSVVTNKVLFLNIKINSSKLGEVKFPVIYAFAENESFCAEKLLPQKANISHIIHVRYGGGYGGGKSSGIWLLNVLKKLKCELFISDGHYAWQDGDNKVKEFYPALAGDGNSTDFECIRTVDGLSWSNHGDVSWNVVA